MNYRIGKLVLLLFIAVAQIANAQSNKDIALKKGKEAIRLMDSGKIDESIALLEETQKLDPEKFDYPYELALAHYMKEDYKGAVKILEKNSDHKNVSDNLFQLLGNCYDILGKTEKAFEAYDVGLKKFPSSGPLYLEKGNVYWGKKDYNKAVGYYEKGIEVDPKFPSNYYRAARIYCNSTEEVWGLIYGEIFINLESNSKRTDEISKLLFDTYRSEIKFTSDSTMSVSFCKNMTMNVSDMMDTNNIKLPFCMIYEPTLITSISLAAERKINLETLSIIKTKFIENYYAMEHDKTHPNILFDYENKIVKAGHSEAYNCWLLRKGDEDAFAKWKSSNTTKWENFGMWLADNELKLDEAHKFYSGQY